MTPHVLAQPQGPGFSSLQGAESSHVLGSSGPRRSLRRPVFVSPTSGERDGQLSGTMSLSRDLAVLSPGLLGAEFEDLIKSQSAIRVRLPGSLTHTACSGISGTVTGGINTLPP